jgi:hypothetical protein
VGVGHPDRPHLVQHDGDAAAGELPGRFAAGEAAADDMDGAGGGAVSVGMWVIAVIWIARRATVNGAAATAACEGGRDRHRDAQCIGVGSRAWRQTGGRRDWWRRHSARRRPAVALGIARFGYGLLVPAMRADLG